MWSVIMTVLVRQRPHVNPGNYHMCSYCMCEGLGFNAAVEAVVAVIVVTQLEDLQLIARLELNNASASPVLCIER